MAGNNFIGWGMDPLRYNPEAGAAAKLRGRAAIMEHALRDLATDAAFTAAEAMRSSAPTGRTGGLHDRIESSEAEWHPGGKTGGGFWEAAAGVIDTGDDYPLFVLRGTGEHGLLAPHLIEPAPGNVFPIQSSLAAASGTIAFRPYQTGQDPQKGWVEDAQLAARTYIAERLDSVPRRGT